MRAFFLQIFKTAAILVIFSYLIPLGIGMAGDIPAGTILALVSSTFILQASTAVVGAATKLSPPAVLIIMTSVALGAVLTIFEICDTFPQQSERIMDWIQRTEQKMKKFPGMQKYGVLSLIVISWIPGLGLYSSAVIAWAFRWKRVTSIFFIMVGWVIATVAILFAANRISLPIG